jgi:hypothetical protein
MSPHKKLMGAIPPPSMHLAHPGRLSRPCRPGRRSRADRSRAVAGRSAGRGPSPPPPGGAQHRTGGHRQGARRRRERAGAAPLSGTVDGESRLEGDRRRSDAGREILREESAREDPGDLPPPRRRRWRDRGIEEPEAAPPNESWRGWLGRRSAEERRQQADHRERDRDQGHERRHRFTRSYTLHSIQCGVHRTMLSSPCVSIRLLTDTATPA